jgi:GT2 family glycosyltransferase
MNADPLVTIVIVNWNGREVTLECLASLRAVTYPSYRIVLVDNGSSDGSADAVRRLHPGVVLLETGANLRFAGGTNAGIRHALKSETEFLLLLNNDTTVEGEFLSFLVSRMKEDPGIGMVVPKILYHSRPDVIWYAGGIVQWWTGTIAHRGIREPDRGQHDTGGETDFATGCCLLVRRSVVERIGLLDESYRMYVEDVDWSWRARGAGYRIFYEPRARIWHKVSVSAGGQFSRFKLTNKFVSSMRFFFRYSTWYQWLVFPWASILLNAFRGIGLLFRGDRP